MNSFLVKTVDPTYLCIKNIYYIIIIISIEKIFKA